MAFDDPIVFPGQTGASHLHTFFGNTGTNAGTTTESLRAATSSTCAGGLANLSAYWVPAMVDTSTNRALIPFENIIYYKSGYNGIPLPSMRVLPNGLRMITGNKPTENKEVDAWGALHHHFECWSSQLPNGRSGLQQSIPACPVGGYIASNLDFPNCWDGVNLDSPDHRSHMAFSGGGVCPASHPVAIATISFTIKYEVTSGQDTRNWRLASDNYETSRPGGYSMHGDIWVNWQEDISTAWTNNCVKSGKDCHGFLLGDGRTTY